MTSGTYFWVTRQAREDPVDWQRGGADVGRGRKGLKGTLRNILPEIGHMLQGVFARVKGLLSMHEAKLAGGS